MERINLTDMDKQVILSLADCNMNITEAARRMFAHRNSIEYHVKRVKKISGLDATKFYDLCKLIQIVKEGDSNG